MSLNFIFFLACMAGTPMVSAMLLMPDAAWGNTSRAGAVIFVVGLGVAAGMRALATMVAEREGS